MRERINDKSRLLHILTSINIILENKVFTLLEVATSDFCTFDTKR